MLDRKQLEERRSYLGGSDIAAAVGISPYTTPYELWQEKALGIIKPKDAQTTKRLTICSKLERTVADLYTDETKRRVRDPLKSFTNKKFPWLIANVDRLIDNTDGILECKTAHPFSASEWGEPGTSQIPEHYLLQVANYCLVLNKPFCDIAVLMGSDFRIYTYERDYTLEKNIVQATRDFWYTYVQPSDEKGNRLPPVAPPVTTKDKLDEIFKTVSGKSVKMGDAILPTFQEYVEVSKKAKELAKQEKQLKDEIKLYMGEAENLEYDGQIVLQNKEFTRKSVPIDSLKTTYPKIYNELLKHTKYKKFALK